MAQCKMVECKMVAFADVAESFHALEECTLE